MGIIFRSEGKLVDDSNMILDRAAVFPTGGKDEHLPARKSEQRVVRDEVDEQLLPVFLEEAGELYPKIFHTLNAWRESSGTDAALRNQLQRSLHTFKGSARMAGAMRLGELAHQLEGRIAGAVAQASFDTALWQALENYLARINAAIEELAGGRGAVASEEVQAHAETQHGRLQPFSCVHERLYRVVRQTAKELGKRVNLELSGGESELDCGVLEKMTAPLEHLLRNAISHGIEAPEQRERMGKTGIGEISLELRLEGAEAVFELGDDGAGLNMASLQQKALEHGLLRPGEEIDEALATQMIFMPGLSTAQEITEICGRGIGLDVVRSEVAALGGRLEVSTVPGRGLAFIIRLPADTPHP